MIQTNIADGKSILSQKFVLENQHYEDVKAVEKGLLLLKLHYFYKSYNYPS